MTFLESSLFRPMSATIQLHIPTNTSHSPFKANEEAITTYFNPAGPIVSLDLQRDLQTKKSKGKCTIHFDSAKSAQRAIAMFDERSFMNKTLHVREVREQTAVNAPSAGPAVPPPPSQQAAAAAAASVRNGAPPLIVSSTPTQQSRRVATTTSSTRGGGGGERQCSCVGGTLCFACRQLRR